MLLATLAVHLRDPHVSGSWGFCPLLLTTGLYCPGCGGLRAVHDLTHLDLGAAASSNLLFVASIPLLVGLWALWAIRAWTGRPNRPWRGTTPTLAAALTIGLVFTVARNLAFGSWLAP